MVIAFCSNLMYLSNPQRTTIRFVPGSEYFLLNINEDFMFVGSINLWLHKGIRIRLKHSSNVLGFPRSSFTTKRALYLNIYSNADLCWFEQTVELPL